MEEILRKMGETSVQSGETLELELRFKKVERQFFTEAYKKFRSKGPGSITTSINSYSPARNRKAKNIRIQTFVNSAKKSDVYLTKISLIDSVDVNTRPRYSVALSKEIAGNTFAPDPLSLVRLKNRESFTQGPWRYDFTLVRDGKLGDLAPILTRLRDTFLKDFPDLLAVDSNIVTGYSIEIEWVGEGIPSPNDIESAASEILSMAPAAGADRVLAQMARILGIGGDGFSIKRLTNQVEGLTKAQYQKIFPPNGYYLTEKADGVRGLLYVNQSQSNLVFGNKCIEYKTSPIGLTIIDGEVIGEDLYAFDILFDDTKDVREEPFSKRLEILEQICKTLGIKFKKQLKIVVGENPTEILEKNIKEIYEAKYPYEIDGLILTTPDLNYNKTISYKWKKTTTIDFLCKRPPSNLLGLSPYIDTPKSQVYILFVSITESDRKDFGIDFLQFHKMIFPQNFGATFPIHFCPGINPQAYIYHHKISDYAENLDGEIVELTHKSNDWKFVKVREDRRGEPNYFGNYFRIAEVNYQNFIAKFPIEQLWSPDFGYFADEVEGYYIPSNKYKRFVLSDIIRKSSPRQPQIVVDLAAGRGADVSIVRSLGAKKLLAVDIDPEALAELTRRKYNTNSKFARSPMLIMTMLEDLSGDSDAIMAKITEKYFVQPKTVQLALCNFAIHYFCGSATSLKRLIKLVGCLLEPNGIFICSLMSGEKVFEKLTEKGNKWVISQDGRDKYIIEKLYRGNEMAKYGQKIKVKLPFSNELVEEFLVNVGELIEVCRTNKLELELHKSFSDENRIAEFSKRKNMELSPQDIEYIEIHEYLTFRKMR